MQYERNPASESMQAMADATGSDPMALIYDALVAGKVLWAPLGCPWGPCRPPGHANGQN